MKNYKSLHFWIILLVISASICFLWLHLPSITFLNIKANKKWEYIFYFLSVSTFLLIFIYAGRIFIDTHKFKTIIKCFIGIIRFKETENELIRAKNQIKKLENELEQSNLKLRNIYDIKKGLPMYGMIAVVDECYRKDMSVQDTAIALKERGCSDPQIAALLYPVSEMPKYSKQVGMGYRTGKTKEKLPW